ncbi:ABC transporter substrate-binding protein [Clostridium intestinale]|uniref:Branched-chain amino acid transport system substrate-binding protein n=1 Tax=Clostridium intestinale DSM 6191 TaxID=1121320 RepID=A0A1M5WTB7_9CLOT|nr:ABC transporter substrate-binding protein [Clostridium intestinale]SHH90283.1 branched-chain amino acid transport system substrate-binding protein [Clostridium intestinale DSM 6191]
MKKKILSALMATAVMGSVLAGCSKSSANSDTINIGAIGPLTGPASTYGQSVKNGAELYLEQVNADGGIDGKKLSLLFEDDEANADKAIQAFNKLVDNDKVPVILGAVTSGATNAVAPQATSRSIPMLTPTATEPNITKNGGEFVFRGCFVDSFQGVALADYATSKLSKKTAAVLYNKDSDYSKGIADAFKKEFESKGGKVTEFLTYNEGDKDFNAQLTKIKGTNSDLLVLPDYYTQVGTVAKQARDMGIQSQLLGGDGWESEELTKLGGTAVNGALYLNHYYSGDSASVVADFVKAYKAKYNAEPDAFAALAYDSTKVIVEAIKSAGTDPVAIKDALAKTKLDGVTGNITFGSDRSAVKGASIIKVNGDKKELVDKVNP